MNILANLTLLGKLVETDQLDISVTKIVTCV